MSVKHTQVQMGERSVQHFVLTNQMGMSVELLSWGATVLDISTPDARGRCESVVLAHTQLADYIDNKPYFGATIGRATGRVAYGQYKLDNATIQLPCNQGEHHLHGGSGAMSHQDWQVKEALSNSEYVRVQFNIVSPAGENAYPGTLDVMVSYTLWQNENKLSIDYQANTDAPTLCNLTNHTYFNLSGNGKRDVQNHLIRVESDSVCAMNEELLVTGDLWSSRESVFDLQNGRMLAELVNSADERIIQAKGVDHYFVLNRTSRAQVTLSDQQSGRRLRVMTDQPCVVLYAHNYADGERLRHGQLGRPFDALCIETQKMPINFESDEHPAALYPNQTYTQHTDFIFDLI